MKHFRQWLALTAFGMFLLACLPVFSAHGAPPNVLFLLTDQWRQSAFGYTGNKDVQTPNLDRLEKESIHFVNAVSGVPVCSPMRASLLTGQRPLTHGVFLNDVPLNPEALSVAKIFRKQGYRTGYIGKWHIDGHGRTRFIPRERRQGFDYWKVLECTHNYTNSFYFADTPERKKWDGYDAIAQTRDARRFMVEQARKKEPFVLFLGFGPPHAPYHSAPLKYRQRYNPARLTLRPNIPHYFREIARKDLAGYYAHCTALDDCVQELRSTLEETGLATNTLVVFTTDHGDLLGSHGAYKKQQPFEESIRVPMLWHWPAGLGETGQRLKAPMNTEDILPTMLGLCGIPVPGSVEGIDFSNYMKGGADPTDGAALLACPAPFGQWARRWGGREFRGLRTDRYTYVRDLRGPWLLFDNQKDPFQLDNLIDHPKHVTLQQRMDQWLQSRLDKNEDRFLTAREYIEQWEYKVGPLNTVRR